MNINSYILKLVGSVELPESIQISHNFKAVISGQIGESRLKDNQNGTFDQIFIFKPIVVETIDELGKALKSKDSRSESKLTRSAIWKQWKNCGMDISEDDYYKHVQGWIRRNIEDITAQAEKEL